MIQGLGNATAAYTTMKTLAGNRPAPSTGATPDPASANSATQLSISDQAKALASESSSDIQTRLAAIKARPAVERSEEDRAFLFQNDSQLAAISAKPAGSLTAEEVDYTQKAGGFVNTMANLSPSEKKLYNQLVAQGNTEAVKGMNLLAMSRMGGGDTTLPDGKTFDPSLTEITAGNVRNLFRHMFADGGDQRSFEALASFLDKQPAGTGTTVAG